MNIDSMRYMRVVPMTLFEAVSAKHKVRNWKTNRMRTTRPVR
jgi:hypothetical protein